MNPIQAFIPGRRAGVWGWVCLMLLCSPALAAERSEDLSGEAEIAQPALTKPDSVEPEPGPAGAAKERPVLKLPEVVVKGDRQYRVSAERRDLLLMDPMWGMKEIPADMAQVAVPGLQEQKAAPQGDTLNARPYVVTLEGGAGTSRLGLGRLVAGWESKSFHAGLRANYDIAESPEAYGFTPYDQDTNAALNIGGAPLSGWELNGEINGRIAQHRQPRSAPSAWLEHWLKQVRLGSELALTPRTQWTASANWSEVDGKERGEAQKWLRTGTLALQTGMEQSITGLMLSDLDLTVDYHYWRQHTQPPGNRDVDETCQQAVARLRLRPVSALLLDGGVRWDDYAGTAGYTSANVVGQISVLLPTGGVLYSSADAGLEWAPAPEWLFAHPHPSPFWLAEPEDVLGHYRLGWRQRWSEQVSMDLAGFRKEAKRTPVWLDGDRDGLFTLAHLPRTLIAGATLTLEVRYTEHVTQSFAYTYRQADAEGGEYPYLPQHEGQTEVRWNAGGTSLELRYRYLGSRAAAAWEPDDPGLKPAHLLEARADFPLWAKLDGFVDLKNMLNYAWEEWAGYPSRGFSVLGGLRLHL